MNFVTQRYIFYRKIKNIWTEVKRLNNAKVRESERKRERERERER